MTAHNKPEELVLRSSPGVALDICRVDAARFRPNLRPRESERQCLLTERTLRRSNHHLGIGSLRYLRFDLELAGATRSRRDHLQWCLRPSGLLHALNGCTGW